MVSLKRVAGWGVLFGAFIYGGYIVGHSTAHPTATPKPHTSTASQATTQASTSAGTPQSGLVPGQFAPNFTLKTTQGNTVTLAQLRGHPVWLNFWATWCPWCKKEIPEIEQVKSQYGNRIDIYGVAIQQPASTVTQYMIAKKMNYPVLLDSQGSVAASYGVQYLPTSVFISSSGKILAVYTGAFLSRQAMAPYLHELLNP
ncbi:TlpA family protein disulfide reductase [Sulfobacillus thermosulfidooxidans]|uniref:TlpA family protein disulfide reductase n=1 Tax=Sulfobacillus thermosulfidooxidans TaxID=28034 RepID=UPI000ABFCC2F|nr:TlpA disulfide reductase family protein [Sulfobacillus thermosulfidooxidans]